MNVISKVSKTSRDYYRIISVEKNMVGVAQLVEHPVVVRDVAGSSPVAHPTSRGELNLDNSSILVLWPSVKSM